MTGTMQVAQRLDVPGTTMGKRSRSNSASSSSSSTSSSAGGSSIFSQYQSASTEGSISSCSSPSSLKSSPASSTTHVDDDERPCKAVRTTRNSVGPLSAHRNNDEDSTLATLEEKCTLDVGPSCNDVEAKKFPTPPPANASLTNNGKTLFVDCLVDATVHVLNMIWNAPVHKSITFLDNVRTASSLNAKDLAHSCLCPVGTPFGGGIPLDLFVRETLRRSRTSCSTLQAALLYCKRIGAEVLRRRAEMEKVELSSHERAILDDKKRAYPSLTRSINASNVEYELPSGVAVDPILCSRRSFLAAIMVSSKFLQDRTFSNRAWSKISGLNVKELGLVERRMLDAIEFDMYVSDVEWQSWTRYLKGEWKAGIENCHCQDVASKQAETSTLSRKALERTTSLHVEDALDTEVTSQSILTLSKSSAQLACHSPLATPNAVNCNIGVSTPTQSSSLSMNGIQTPTRVVSHKRELSLLAAAVNNSALGALHVSPSVASESANVDQTDVTASAVRIALPFPLRKGLAMRSISTQ